MEFMICKSPLRSHFEKEIINLENFLNSKEVYSATPNEMIYHRTYITNTIVFIIFNIQSLIKKFDEIFKKYHYYIDKHYYIDPYLKEVIDVKEKNILFGKYFIAADIIKTLEEYQVGVNKIEGQNIEYLKHKKFMNDSLYN